MIDRIQERLAAACEADGRVLAAYLYGSHVAGTADEHSDVDLCLIVADGARDAVWTEREDLIRQLGEPLLLEDFDDDRTIFFILADGTEGELTIADAGHLAESSRGPHRVILDRTGVLDGVTFTGSQPGDAAQLEGLRRQVQWFWHDLSHFIAAIGRDQPWWAAGQLAELRTYCVNLARLRADFAAPMDGFDKVDLALPASELAALADTFVPMDRESMLSAAHRIVEWYRSVVPDLAAAHGVPYPADLERIMVARLRALG